MAAIMSKRLSQSVSGQSDANAGRAAVPPDQSQSQTNGYPE